MVPWIGMAGHCKYRWMLWNKSLQEMAAMPSRCLLGFQAAKHGHVEHSEARSETYPRILPAVGR
jgi:hypothetical protein